MTVCASFENSKLAQPVIARRFFTWTPADIFTQFCRAKLQRTVNRLCLSYYVPPSAALWNPNSFIHFNFLGNLYTIFIKIEKLDIRPKYYSNHKNAPQIVYIYGAFSYFRT